MPKISALPDQTTPDGADQLPTNDVSATTTKKMTLTVLKEWLQSLAGWITTDMISDTQVTAPKIDFTTLPTYEFMCYLTSTWNPTGATTNNAMVTGATVVYQSSSTVSSTGVFTAPVNGVYDFSGAAYTNSQSSLTVSLNKNGSTYLITGIKAASTGASRLPMVANGIKLNAGDTVYLEVSVSANPAVSGGQANTWFSGHLVRAL